MSSSSTVLLEWYPYRSIIVQDYYHLLLDSALFASTMRHDLLRSSRTFINESRFASVPPRPPLCSPSRPGIPKTESSRAFMHAREPRRRSCAPLLLFSLKSAAFRRKWFALCFSSLSFLSLHTALITCLSACLRRSVQCPEGGVTLSQLAKLLQLAPFWPSGHIFHLRRHTRCPALQFAGVERPRSTVLTQKQVATHRTEGKSECVPLHRTRTRR